MSKYIMKIFLRVLLILIVLLIGYILYHNSLVKEGFISGTQVQLLTSKPYYTWYDYISRGDWFPWRYPIQYRYPLPYRYPNYTYPRYYYGYPFYRPYRM